MDKAVLHVINPVVTVKSRSDMVTTACWHSLQLKGEWTQQRFLYRALIRCLMER